MPVGQKPIFGGCFGVAVVGALLGATAVFVLVFLDSGANTGRLVMRNADSYRAGTVEFVGERNFFVVRLANGDFLALADLDAANRAAEGRRCRVAALTAADARLPGLLEQYRSEMSVEAVGSTLLFREECNGAVYDLSGKRLDAGGRNLDRYATSVDAEGRLRVDVSRRICTAEEEGESFAAASCMEVAGKDGLP